MPKPRNGSNPAPAGFFNAAQGATRTGSGGNAAAKNQEEAPTAYAARAHATGAGSAGGGDSRTDGGTETPHTGPAAPANRRTASGKPTQPDHADAKAEAAADEEKPATTTAPANDRTDRRSRQRQAPAAKANPTSRRHHGADSGDTSEPRETTSAREPTTENDATTPPHTPARKTRRDPERRAPQRARNRMATSTARRRRRGQGRGGRKDAPDRQARAGQPAPPCARPAPRDRTTAVRACGARSRHLLPDNGACRAGADDNVDVKNVIFNIHYNYFLT